MDMAELLPDRLGVNAGPVGTSEKDDKQSPKTKRRQVTNIFEWIQCYSIYMAVVAEKHPEKIQDLLGYQTLIVEAQMEYDSDTWLGYDRRFRQNAPASPGTVWARIDPTLWNVAFTGQAKSRRCKYCFSLSHQSVECDWVPANPSTQPTNAPPSTNTRFNPRSRADQVCYSWNHSPETKLRIPRLQIPACLLVLCQRSSGHKQGAQGHVLQPPPQPPSKTARWTSAANEARQCTALSPLLDTAGTIMTKLSSWHCHVALLITHAVSSLGFGHSGLCDVAFCTCGFMYYFMCITISNSQEHASTADNEYIQYIIDGIANDPFLTPLTGSISIPDTLFDDAVLEDILLTQELPSLATSEGSWLC